MSHPPSQVNQVDRLLERLLVSVGFDYNPTCFIKVGDIQLGHSIIFIKSPSLEENTCVLIIERRQFILLHFLHDRPAQALGIINHLLSFVVDHYRIQVGFIGIDRNTHITENLSQLFTDFFQQIIFHKQHPFHK
ncbi:hypothetical protein EMIT0P100_20213 [Pseudomonas sp. IT-P100]